MFAREQRPCPARLPATRRPSDKVSSHEAWSEPVLLRKVCPCGGGCAECAAEHQQDESKFAFPAQAKLRIGAIDDPLEREADRVADQVMAAPTHPGVSSVHMRRNSAEFNKQIGAVPPSVDRALASPGRPLEPTLRQDMEARFGHDFSGVQVHSGAAAEQSARDVNADAYTLGHHMVFGTGQFAPQTHEGRRLIAHELTHIVQYSGIPTIKRQPTTPVEKSKFEFMLGDVERQQVVLAVLHPTDPAEFLQAFEEKGRQLIGAEYKWLSNNLLKFTRDAVLKQKRNPFADLNSETLRKVASQAYEKAVGALVVRGGTEAAGAILKLIHIGEKVIFVGKKASGFASKFGGFLAWIGQALVQFLIGPLFDKSNELVKQALEQFEEAMRTVVDEDIIPKVQMSTTLFDKFMTTLGAYLLQDTDEPERKPSPKPGSAKFSIGENEYAVTVEIDTTVPLTDRRRDQIIIDLANVVLAINEVVPRLESDLSLYNDLAQRTGVFSGSVAKASPAHGPASGKLAAARDLSFKMTRRVIGETKFDVPPQGVVEVMSEAHYPDAGWKEMEAASSYEIALYRVRGGWHGDKDIEPAKEYPVDKSETAAWYGLDEGEYYLVIEKGGNPSVTLEGNLRVEVRKP